LPPTPFHFLAAALLHFRRPKNFDIAALLFSSTCVDLELLYLLFVGKPMYHGIWHSYFFVLTVYPAVLSLVLYLAEKRFSKKIKSIYGFFRFFPEKIRYPFGIIYFSCLVGGLSHIFFDMWVHRVSSYLLFPFSIFDAENPFWIGRYEVIVHIGVGLLSLYAIYIWIRYTYNLRKKDARAH